MAENDKAIPADIQAEAEKHVPKDSDVKRNRIGRNIVAGSILLICFAACAFAGWYIADTLWSNFFFQLVGILAGLAFATKPAEKMTPRIIKVVPTWQGLVTMDNYTNNMVVYGPGFHASYPWETVSRKDHQPLKVIYMEHKETFPAGDDLLEVTIGFYLLPELKRLHIFRGVDESTLDKGFFGRFSEAVADKLSKFKTAAEAKENISKIAKEIREEFGIGTHAKDPDSVSDKINLEQKFGVILLGFVIPDADFSKEVQEARKAKAKTEAQFKAVAALMGLEPAVLRQRLDAKDETRISHKDFQVMLDRAMVNSKAAELKIISIEGAGGSDLLSAWAADQVSSSNPKKGKKNG